MNPRSRAPKARALPGYATPRRFEHGYRTCSAILSVVTCLHLSNRIAGRHSTPSQREERWLRSTPITPMIRPQLRCNPDSFVAPLAECGMPTSPTTIAREHVEAFITDLLERWKPGDPHRGGGRRPVWVSGTSTGASVAPNGAPGHQLPLSSTASGSGGSTRCRWRLSHGTLSRSALVSAATSRDSRTLSVTKGIAAHAPHARCTLPCEHIIPRERGEVGGRPPNDAPDIVRKTRGQAEPGCRIDA